MNGIQIWCAQVKPCRALCTLARAERPLQGGAHGEAACLTQPLSQVFLSIRTTDVQSPSIHSTRYLEGCHHMKTRFEEVEKGPLAQESMLPNKSEMKPLPPHELLVYERGCPPHHVNMSPLSDMSWTGYCLNPQIVNYWHAPYWELTLRRKHFMTLRYGWIKRGFKPPSGVQRMADKRES